jgi:hypothetical protein
LRDYLRVIHRYLKLIVCLVLATLLVTTLAVLIGDRGNPRSALSARGCGRMAGATISS